MKKFTSIFLSVILILNIFCALGITVSAETGGDFEYKLLNDGTAEITKYKGSASSLSIPSDLDGYKVTRIGYKAFYEYTTLTIISIPDSVSYIGNSAFDGCTNLKNLTIPNGVTWIGSKAFYDTAYYNNESNWEDGVLYVGKHLIEAKSYISKAYSVNNNTLTIANCAFENCTNLTSIAIPDSVTIIGASAFIDCTSLTSIAIPDSVTSIGDSAFKNCTNLTSATIGNNVTFLQRTFENCTSLTSITIPDSVTFISGAFVGCTSLTSVAIPNSVTYIGGAFYGCTSLTSVVIPNSVTGSDGAFYDCTSLMSVTISESVTSIGKSAFGNCTSLTSITIPDSVTNIDKYAFSGCSNLNYALYNGYKSSLSIASGNEPLINVIKYIKDGGTFNNGEWYFDLENDALKITGTGNMEGTVPWSVYNNEIKSVTIGSGITSIADYAFESCANLNSMTIPNSVTSIGLYAFFGCSSLTSVTIPKSVTSIGYAAFDGCSNAKIIYEGTASDWAKIHFGSYWVEGMSSYGYSSNGYNLYINNQLPTVINLLNVENVTDGAFAGANELTEVTADLELKSIGSEAFSCSKLNKLTIPSSVSLKHYNSGSVRNIASFYAKNITEISIVDGSTEISKDFGELVKESSINQLVIPSSITYIGDSIFKDCLNLKKVTIPKEVTRIEYNAFSGCVNITLQGYKNSYAETYANMTGIPFEVIAEDTPTAPTQPTEPTSATEPTTPTQATEPTETQPTTQQPPTPTPKINKTKASIKAGGTVTLKVTNGTVKTWSTSNKAVATVSKGKVTGLKKGAAIITAKLLTGEKLTCKVTVTTSPKLSKSSVSVKKSKTVSVKITGKASTVKNVYTNTKYAKVISKNTATTIKVKGLKKGSTILKIKVNGVVLKLKVKVK